MSFACPSPKATHEQYIGDHIANLAIKKNINLSPIATLKNLDNLPVWIDEPTNSLTPKFYTNIFWDIEPMGEYIYFLAGDFQKNEKGLLRFPTASTQALVEINFEDDVISVAKHDGKRYQNYADEVVHRLPEFQNLTIAELSQKIPRSSHNIDSLVAFLSLNPLLPDSSKGYARMEIRKPMNSDKTYLTLIYEEFYEPVHAYEHERYLKIEVSSSDNNRSIKKMTDELLVLIEKYQNMPYNCVTGTTRG